MAQGTSDSSNSVNEIAFSDTIEGAAFGSGVLAITLSSYYVSIHELAESDIIFNTAYNWDSFRGPLKPQALHTYDIQRVVLHELGHVLGLDHPDENGQSVTALMNSHVSDLDVLAQDDIDGAQSLYGVHGNVTIPGNDSFAAASTISLATGSLQVTGTNVYATKESGEPRHAGFNGGHSVWWKWTAPVSGSVALSTEGSWFDTILAVYTGSVVSGLSTIASNDEANPGVSSFSALTFNANAGTTYYFAVDGYAAESGRIVLGMTFSPPVTAPPVITSQPSNQTVGVGQTAQFTAFADGTPAPTLQWQRFSTGVLVGVSGSGKSTFSRRHFKPTEVLSSDFCRGLVSDEENNQAATKDAFEILQFIARKRLAAGKLTVVDATNVQSESRKPFVQLAREFHCLPVAIVLNVSEHLAHDRNKTRADRDFGPHVVRQQTQQLHRSLRNLEREGFRHVFILKSPEEIESVSIERQPLWNNLKHLQGPFDIIGDVHGCFDELIELLGKLGYAVDLATFKVTAPADRKLVFVGDLVDRGPKIPQVLKLVMSAVSDDVALCVPGNHDVKLMRKLRGRDVQVTHGLADSLAQLQGEPEDFSKRVAEFVDDLVSHYVLDGGRLVVAHAGMKESMQGRGSGAVRDFALYGETTGETDEFGLPVRYNWAAEYRGSAMVIYGHTPVPQPEWLNRTLNIDTGCVFGGQLTALRYPEKELVSVPARRVYAEPSKPFLAPDAPAQALDAQQQHDDLLDLSDVAGKRIVGTRLHHTVTIREENATAALEVMSRFAANPKWLIYLPPTMSPCETSKQAGLLEHPAEAFAYYRNEGVGRVICEQKHMGSRAVVVVCRDAEAARKRFGVVADETGICYTRTGRRFFDDPAIERAFLDRVNNAVTSAGLWDEFKTDWLCLDCELMPWSAKAQALLQEQYAPVGTAAATMLGRAVELLQMAARRGLQVDGLSRHTSMRRSMAAAYVAAYQNYCWPVNSVDDLRLAPFHLLATEGQLHMEKPHDWHMQTLARLAGGMLISTNHRFVEVNNDASVAEGIQWWEELTSKGGEGMVVKPCDFVAHGRRGILQPAVKCRGPEYLRIIYGPEYTAPENLERLRARGLHAKRSLALREFALGFEGLERFVHGEPLRRVHECVFGVLALESEPVDPRL